LSDQSQAERDQSPSPENSPDEAPSQQPALDSATGETNRETVESLVEEIHAAVENASAAADVASSPTRRRTRMVLTLAGCLAAWVVVLAFVPRPAGLSEATLRDGARLTLYFASLRVQAFRDSTGHLPASLQEAGVDEEDVSYASAGDTAFALSYQLPNGQLTLRSPEDDSTIVGALRASLRSR
jgi:hypothetical protein